MELPSGDCEKGKKNLSSHIQISKYIGSYVKSKFYFNHICLSENVFSDFYHFGPKIDPLEVHLPHTATRRPKHINLSRTFKPLNPNNRFFSQQDDLPSKWSPPEIGALGQLHAGGVGRKLDSKWQKKGIYFRVAIPLDFEIFSVYIIAWWFFNLLLFFSKPCRAASANPTAQRVIGMSETPRFASTFVVAPR